MLKLLDRYFEGGWVAYGLTFVLGMAAERYLITPGEEDGLVFGAAIFLMAFMLFMRWVLDEPSWPHRRKK